MKLCRFVIVIFTVSLLAGCGGSDPAALKEEACGAFTRGVDRLNVDDTAYESFNKAYKAFDKLAISFKQPEEAKKVVAPKKTTITCVKGKTTKKVTAVKPKCPSGYKKK